MPMIMLMLVNDPFSINPMKDCGSPKNASNRWIVSAIVLMSVMMNPKNLIIACSL